MSNVKGALMMQVIKVIRANKTGIYDDKFSAADWKVLKGIIFPSSWYPFDLYKKMLNAAAEVEIETSDENLFNWGYESADLLLTTLYNTFLIEGSVEKTIKNYIGFNKMVFDSSRIEMYPIEDKKMQLGFSGFTSDFEVFYRIVRGWIHRIFERAGAKDIKSHFVAKSWEGDSDTLIEYTWK